MYTPEFEGYPPGYFPPTEELVVTSAPLKAAAFYVGDQCQVQNDDYMACKEATGADPYACLKEGRRVTNCVQHV